MHRSEENLINGKITQRNEAEVETGALNERNEQINLPPTIAKQLRISWLRDIIWPIFFATVICLSYWEEGRAARSLDEALEKVVEIVDTNKIPLEYEGKLVYLSGELWVSKPLTDPTYGIAVESIILERRVEVYQWDENREYRTGEVREDQDYNSTLEWRDALENSDIFYIRRGHENPEGVPIKSQIQIAEEAGIGNIKLGIDLKKKFNDFIEVTSDQKPERRDIKMHSDLYYHPADLWNPRVGDVRISFSYTGKAGEIFSIVGKLENGVVVPYITSDGEEILLQRKHKVNVDRMLHYEEFCNNWSAFVIRESGWYVFFDVADCFAEILEMMILNSSFLGRIIAIDSSPMSASLSRSLWIIIFAWHWYRILVALGLALTSGLSLYTLNFSHPTID